MPIYEMQFQGRGTRGGTLVGISAKFRHLAPSKRFPLALLSPKLLISWQLSENSCVVGINLPTFVERCV